MVSHPPSSIVSPTTPLPLYDKPTEEVFQLGFLLLLLPPLLLLLPLLLLMLLLLLLLLMLVMPMLLMLILLMLFWMLKSVQSLLFLHPPSNNIVASIHKTALEVDFISNVVVPLCRIVSQPLLIQCF